jgi:hypothetical protein
MHDRRDVLPKLGLAVLLACCPTWWMTGCSRSKPPSAHRDVVDHDFIATIAPTRDPMTFIVRVERVNLRPRKEFAEGGHRFHLAARNAAGQSFTVPIGRTQGLIPASSGANSMECRIRIFPQNLPPGVYTVEPRMRILETGADALCGPYTDFGTVAVPAGNSSTITIK